MKRSFVLVAALACLAIYSDRSRAEHPAHSVADQKAEAGGLLRTVKGRVLTSPEMPAVRLEFPGDFKYAGGQSFILYDVARAEQHFFVDATKDGRIRRFYWVQFEGYLPDNTNSYRYKPNRTVSIGGLEFIADTYARNIKANPGRPDSDGSRARAFLESKGFRFTGDDVASQRLVHLIDQAKRNELMIIYMEDLAPTGFTAADLNAGGRAAGQWEKFSNDLLDRAVKGIKVLR
jgi:hypothetical protein